MMRRGSVIKAGWVAMVSAGLALAILTPELAFSEGWGNRYAPAPPPYPGPGGVIVVPGGGPSRPGYPPAPAPYPAPYPPPPGGNGPPVIVVPGGGPHGPGPHPVPPHPVPPHPVPTPYPPGGNNGPPVIVVPGGGPLHTPPPGSADPMEQDVADLVSSSIAGYGCNDIGSALLNLSNELLGAVTFAQEGNPYKPMPYQPPRAMSRQEFLQRWISHLSNPQLMQKVWDRLAQLYQSCDKPCFDDGNAVGQLSAVGYCAASIGVGGLDGPGAIPQAPLPLCENSTFVGCLQSYQSAASSYAGCAQYTAGAFDSIFRQSESQDCHMDR